MEFSYNQYHEILKMLMENKYVPQAIGIFQENKKVLFLRHDVDIDYHGVLPMARIENELQITSTWYFLPDCPVYNLCSDPIKDIIKQLSEWEHTIGLHIDASQYSSFEDLADGLNRYFDFFSKVLPLSKTFSFHKPAKGLLANLHVQGWVNAYADEYFSNVVYVSDSNRRKFFYEDRLKNAITNNNPITLLTHPLWWHEEIADPEKTYELACEKIGSRAVGEYLSKTCKLYSS
ncbi:hypothetical protein [Pleomorphochaeta sp. DL1XJH-081]|uniref:hypothetical protein n=1 Tax=Pleomorphochaeta sp. DL1XJH-081 TaxID=3409690 RepID=UPI003BB4F371